MHLSNVVQGCWNGRAGGDGHKKTPRGIARRWDGGAGNRTLVRISFRNGVYVRRPEFSPSPRAGNRPTFPQPISCNLAPDAGASPEASPDFRFAAGAPDGLQTTKVREASLAQLTQPVPDQYWQVNRSKFFSQGPGPGHAAIPSTDPSKPVAPSGVWNIATGAGGGYGRGQASGSRGGSPGGFGGIAKPRKRRENLGRLRERPTRQRLKRPRFEPWPRKRSRNLDGSVRGLLLHFTASRSCRTRPMRRDPPGAAAFRPFVFSCLGLPCPRDLCCPPTSPPAPPPRRGSGRLPLRRTAPGRRAPEDSGRSESSPEWRQRRRRR